MVQNQASVWLTFGLTFIAWDGIHVIGSFDKEDKEAAEAELSETSYDFEVTIEPSQRMIKIYRIDK